MSKQRKDKATGEPQAPAARVGWEALPGGWEYWEGGFVRQGKDGFYARPRHRGEMPTPFPTLEGAMAAVELGYDPRWVEAKDEPPTVPAKVVDFDLERWVSPLIAPPDRRRLKWLKVPGSKWFATWPVSGWFDDRFEWWLPGHEHDSERVHARLVALGAKSACYRVEGYDYATLIDLRDALQQLDNEASEYGRQDALLLCVPGRLAFFQTHHGDRVIVSTSFNQTRD